MESRLTQPSPVFYGMDAIGTADIESIEVARGSGMSLTAPEAIGGTINIILANHALTVSKLISPWEHWGLKIIQSSAKR